MKKTILKWVSSVVAFAVISHLVWFLSFLATRSLYGDSRYYPVWSQMFLDMLRNVFSWQAVVAMVVIGLVTGVIYTLVYDMLKDVLRGGVVKKALMFSLVTFATGGIHMLLGAWSMLYVPAGVLIAWFITNAVSSVATSFALIAIHKK